MLLGFINLRYSQFDPHLFSIQLCFLTPINDLKHVISYDRALYVTRKYVQCIVQLYYTYMYTYAAHSLKGSGHQLPMWGTEFSPSHTSATPAGPPTTQLRVDTSYLQTMSDPAGEGSVLRACPQHLRLQGKVQILTCDSDPQV